MKIMGYIENEENKNNMIISVDDKLFAIPVELKNIIKDENVKVSVTKTGIVSLNLGLTYNEVIKDENDYVIENEKSTSITKERKKIYVMDRYKKVKIDSGKIISRIYFKNPNKINSYGQKHYCEFKNIIKEFIINKIPSDKYFEDFNEVRPFFENCLKDVPKLDKYASDTWNIIDNNKMENGLIIERRSTIIKKNLVGIDEEEHFKSIAFINSYIKE